jgi:hypothetical protein
MLCNNGDALARPSSIQEMQKVAMKLGERQQQTRIVS